MTPTIAQDGAFEDMPRNTNAGVGNVFSAPTPAGEPRPHYVLLSIEQLFALQSPPWLVHQVIRQGEFVVLYGEPECGKTFVAIDLALKVASQSEWWGYSTSGGGALYLAGEGAFGLKKRVQAWELTRDPRIDVIHLPLRILPIAVPFLDKPSFECLIASLKAQFPKPAVIFVDTLARHIVGGDENTAEDMGVFVDRCTQLQVATGAAVIVIHHTAKTAEFERGSSALRGAADGMIRISRSDDVVTVRGDKAKDVAPLAPITLEFQHVWIADDEDGNPVNSLVLRRMESAEVTRAPVGKSDTGRVIRETLAKFFDAPASGSALQAESGLPRSTFYRGLQAEQDAGRIVRSGIGREVCYELSPSAPEFVAPLNSAASATGGLSLTESHQSHGTPAGTQGVEGAQSQVSVPPTPLGVGMGRDWDGTNPASKPLHPGEKDRTKRRKAGTSKPSKTEGTARP